jgi:RHS repeat-associated protein
MRPINIQPRTLIALPATISRSFCFTGCVARTAMLFCALVAAVSAASAQNIQFTQGSVGSGLDNSLQLSLRAYPGRGQASLPVSLYYSSKVWRIKYTGTIYNPYDRSQSEPMTQAMYAEHSAAGWTSSLGVPTLEWPESNQVYDYKGKSVCLDCRNPAFSPDNYWKVPRLTIHMPDGSAHELRRDDTPYTGPVNNAGTYYAVDGSRLRYDTSTATLFLPDGSHYVLGESTVQFIDRNGNTLGYDRGTGQWIDTLGRVISSPPLTSSPGDYPYLLPGLDGTLVTYTFRWAYLSNVLEPDPATGVMPQLGYAGDYYVAGTPSFNNPPQTLPGPHLFHTTENIQLTNDYVIASQSPFNPVVLSEIELPNGLKYKFSYNEYGEIAKVVYPTGGFEQYKYGQITTVSSADAPYDQSNRGVISRWVSPTGTGTDRAQWEYGVIFDAANNKYKQWMKSPVPDNTYTERFLFKAPPISQYTNQNYPKFGFEDPRNGMAYDERVYEYQGGPMLRRKLTDSTYSSRNVTVSFAGQTTTASASRNPRPVKDVSLVLDTGGEALAKTLTYAYDSTYEFSTGLDLTTSTESHFATIDQTTAQTGAIGIVPIGPTASTTVTTYLDDANYRNRNILGLASSVILEDANGQPVSKTVTGYDETPLKPYDDLGSTWTDPGPYRANITTVRRYTNAAADVSLNVPCPAGVCLDTHAEHDQVGNAWKSKNERGIESQAEFPSTYKHAYATSTTTAVPDPSGVHGSNVAFTSSSVFDSMTGLVLTTTDANYQTTTFSYRDEQNVPDPLIRLRKVTRPDGSWTKTEFNDVVGNLYTVSESQFDATRTTKGYQFFDALGRAIRSLALESGTTYLASDVQYDQMGRVWRSSNPYRAQGLNGAINPSGIWTTNQFDALGRVTTVTLPDNTTVQSTYQGIYTTVIDPAGKQRRQKADALGRIVRVDEPDASGNLGTVDGPTQATSYDYNTQGNVIHVQQGTGATVQNRYFKYDGVGRLIYERQVEQAGILSSFDPLTGNSAWSRKLVYDETINGVTYSGLLTTAYDARNISTQFQYDNLNRVWQIAYSDGTPAITNNYDQTRPGYLNKGRLTEASTAAVASLPATSQTYNYDLMGRVANNQQTVGDQTYSLTYGYNAGGALTSETYPSGRVVSYAFDSAARLAQVSSGSTVYANQFDYSLPQGLLRSFALGNGAVESFDYNSRLQLKSLDLAKSGTVLQHYDYKYGVFDPNSNSLDESKNNGQIARIEGTIGTQKQWQQNFAYDSIGRLSSARELRGDNNQQSYLINYDYDLFGNRYQKQSRNGGNPFTQVWTEDADIDQMTNRVANNVSYDNAGNVLVDQKFRQLKFQYDANNRQRQSSNLDDTSAVVSVYDAGGQRVATQVAGSLTNVLVYDALGKLVAEYGNSSATNGTHYIFGDHQGSTRAVMKGSGAASELVVARHDYLPFGEELYANVGMRSNGQGYNGVDSVRQKYAGMETDDATGMAHTLWRQYDSSSGRWTSPDPYGGSMTITDPQSFNRYSYVNNNPVNLTDPSGLKAGLGYYYREADLSWGDVSNSFWGRPDISTAGRRDVGMAHIARGMYRHDNLLRTPLEDESDDVWVSAEVTGVAEEQQNPQEPQKDPKERSPWWRLGLETPEQKDARERAGIKCWRDEIEFHRKEGKEINDRYDALLKAAFTSNIKQSLFWAVGAGFYVGAKTKNPGLGALAAGGAFLLSMGKGVFYDGLIGQFRRTRELTQAGKRHDAQMKYCRQMGGF